MLTTFSVAAQGRSVPNPKWLVEGLIPLGQGGAITFRNEHIASLEAIDLALTVGSTLDGDGPRTWRARRVTAKGSSCLLHGSDDKSELHRRIRGVDPSGARGRAAAGKVILAPYRDIPGGAPKIFAGNGDKGVVIETPAARSLRLQLSAIKDLRLVIINPITDFLPPDWVEPERVYPIFEWINQLATETGATVIGIISEDDYRLLQGGANKC